MPEDTPGTVAAELALGLLDGEERAAATRRMLAEPVFAAEVARWRDHFAWLALDVPEVAAPETLWPRIAATLAPDRALAAPLARLRLWQSVAGLAAAVAAVFAFLLFQPRPPVIVPMPTPPRALYVAQIAGPAEATVGAAFDPAVRRLRLTRPAPVTIPNGRMQELWLIPADGTPRALGRLPVDSTAIAVSEGNARAFGEGAALAISMEREAEAQPAAPAGPILAKGIIGRV